MPGEASCELNFFRVEEKRAAGSPQCTPLVKPDEAMSVTTLGVTPPLPRLVNQSEPATIERNETRPAAEGVGSDSGLARGDGARIVINYSRGIAAIEEFELVVVDTGHPTLLVEARPLGA